MKLDLPDPQFATLAVMQVRESSTNLCDILKSTVSTPEEAAAAGLVTTVIESQNDLITRLFSEWLDMMDLLKELADKIPDPPE